MTYPASVLNRPLPPPVPSAEEEASREIARRLEAENPRWIVIYGGSSGEFVCYPRFNATPGTIIIARYPAAIPPRMRRIEDAALKRTRQKSAHPRES